MSNAAVAAIRNPSCFLQNVLFSLTEITLGRRKRLAACCMQDGNVCEETGARGEAPPLPHTHARWRERGNKEGGLGTQCRWPPPRSWCHLSIIIFCCGEGTGSDAP